MIINVTYSEEEVTEAHFAVYLRKTSTWLRLFVAAILILVTAVSSLIFKIGHIIGVLPILISTVFVLTWNFLLAKSKFLTDKKFRENIRYDFQETMVKISGSSFNTQMLWSTVDRVIATNRWIFIQVKSKIAWVIPKNAFFESELLQLKDILRSQNVRNNL